MRERVYEGSDGRYYTDVELWERLETETWVPFAWDPDDGREWVETERRDILALQPVPESELPDAVELKPHPQGVLVNDERDPSRTTPGDRD